MLKTANSNSIFLFKIYYVPDFSVNLLFSKKICEKRLKGNFDKKNLRLQLQNNKTIVKAKKYRGIYIIEKIAKEINEEFAFGNNKF